MTFIVKTLAFARNGEGEEFYSQTDTVGEITEVSKDGFVEIAFNTPAKERHFVTFRLADVAQAAIEFALSETKRGRST